MTFVEAVRLFALPRDQCWPFIEILPTGQLHWMHPWFVGSAEPACACGLVILEPAD